MSNILVGSPRFESKTTPALANSVVLTLVLDNVTRYTIAKNAITGTVELIKDYIEQTFTGGQSQPKYVDTTGSTMQGYTEQNGGGVSTGSATAITHKALDGYGTFMEGINPTLPTSTAWLISKDVIKNNYFVYVPYGVGGWISQITAGGSITQTGFNDQTTFLTINSTLPLYIKRIDCSKYGDGHKITFLNKFGALQDLWFFLKSVRTLSSTKENYNSNTISQNGLVTSYSVNAPTKKIFNRSAKQTIRLSSGFYPEGTNPVFEQLLLSKSIWLTQADPNDPTVEQIVPVIIRTSSFTEKTSLNDSLIEYSMDFEMAFDYINNVR